MSAIDPRLLTHYNRELGYLRRHAREFAEEHRQVAGRLGLDAPTNPDPHVERLLEGVAFLNARVRLKIDDQFPEFTQYLLDALYPHYVAPTPAMAIVTLTPREGDEALKAGPVVRRGAALTASLGSDPGSLVELRTGQDVALWPLRLAAAEYLPTRAAMAAATGIACGESAVRLRIEMTAPGTLAELALDRLDLFIDGGENTPGLLHHQMLGESHPVLVAHPDRGRRDFWVEAANTPEPLGLTTDTALLPTDPRSFGGYRLLAEYFAFPEKFRFVRLSGLARGFARADRALDLFIPLKRAIPALVAAVAADNFRLHATPAINLFARRLDRITVDRGQPDHLILPDRARQQDYELFALTSVTAHRAGDPVGSPVLPMYARHAARGEQPLFYSLRRRLRRLSTPERRRRRESDYVGTETWIALSAPGQPTLVDEIAELALEGFVTNRALSTRLRPGAPDLVLMLENMAGVGEVRMARGPSRPQPPLGIGDGAWRIVSHLAPGHRGFAQPDGRPDRLLDHLRLYVRDEVPALSGEIDGIVSLRSEHVTRRAQSASGGGLHPRLAFERGERLTIGLAGTAYEAGTSYLFTMVVGRFLAEFAAINSFVEVAVETDTGLKWSWPMLPGSRPTI